MEIISMNGNATKRMKLWTENPYCFVCGKLIPEFGKSTLEHIIPKSKGGSNAINNLAVSHRICNLIKGNHLNPADWKFTEKWSEEKILRTPMDDFLIKRIIRKSFADLEFVMESLERYPDYYLAKFPKSHICDDTFRTFIFKLRRLSIQGLIEASLKLHNFGSKSHWKIIFSIVFIEQYLKTREYVPLLHAIWRLNSLKGNEPTLISHLYSEDLLDICRNFEPVAYEKFISFSS